MNNKRFSELIAQLNKQDWQKIRDRLLGIPDPTWFQHFVWNNDEYDPSVGLVQEAWYKFKDWYTYQYCKAFGHKLYDDSSAGSESGNMDHGCERCGMYWHIPLY